MLIVGNLQIEVLRRLCIIVEEGRKDLCRGCGLDVIGQSTMSPAVSRMPRMSPAVPRRGGAAAEHQEETQAQCRNGQGPSPHDAAPSLCLAKNSVTVASVLILLPSTRPPSMRSFSTPFS